MFKYRYLGTITYEGVPINNDVFEYNFTLRLVPGSTGIACLCQPLISSPVGLFSANFACRSWIVLLGIWSWEGIHGDIVTREDYVGVN